LQDSRNFAANFYKHRNVSISPVGTFLFFLPLAQNERFTRRTTFGKPFLTPNLISNSFNFSLKMANYTYLTQSGYDKLKTELEELKTTGRQEAARAIAEARAQGDLSENAEYDAAKDAQGMLEMKISELETVLANARIIDESQLDASKVAIMSNVTIKNLKTGKEMTYKLVSETEADAKQMKISVTSPIGQGLLGKTKGQVAKISTPGGALEFEVTNITIG
jgi:transcription elongation factor GreA